MTNKDKEIAKQLAERLREAASQSVKRIILYGSRATGTANSDSDFDFLVVESGPVSVREEMKRLRQSTCDLRYSVDAWVMGEEEFEETKTIIGGLAYPANKYGKVVYENA
jgi:predicted nucleotidyltransferase